MEEISNYFRSVNYSIPYNILTDDKSATIGNYEISDGIEEVPIKDNTTYYPQKYGTEIRNEYYKSNKKLSNSFNSNTTPFTFSQSFQDGNYLNNNNNNIYNNFSRDRRTNNFFPRNNNVFEFNNYINKTNIKSQNSPIKKTKSKYSSVSENKYHFLKKIGNQKYENPLLSENNIFKINR